jgi:FkbM family methyltransferase
MALAPARVDRLGEAIRQSLRRCVGWPGWLDPLKALWILGGFVLLRSPLLKTYRPELQADAGFRLDGGLADCTLNAIVFYRGVYEPVLGGLMQQLINEGDLCVDVGANAGYFTLLAAARVGPAGRVFAVEAAPANVARIRRNVELNEVAERVEVVAAACTDRTGELLFYVNESNDMHCRLELPRRGEADYWLVRGRWQPVTVAATTLAAVLGDRAAEVSFIKLDVEGAEPQVVPDILAQCTHPRLCVALEAKAEGLRATLGAFEQAGFHAYDLRNDYRWLVNSRVRRPRSVSYETLYSRGRMADVLLARQPLAPHLLA